MFWLMKRPSFTFTKGASQCSKQVLAIPEKAGIRISTGSKQESRDFECRMTSVCTVESRVCCIEQRFPTIGTAFNSYERRVISKQFLHPLQIANGGSRIDVLYANLRIRRKQLPRLIATFAVIIRVVQTCEADESIDQFAGFLCVPKLPRQGRIRFNRDVLFKLGPTGKTVRSGNDQL